MNKRTTSIFVRVSKKEKKQIDRYRKLCGLTLSEYLRQRAFGYEPKPIPPWELTEILDRMTGIYTNSKGTMTPETEAKLVDIIGQLHQKIYLPEVNANGDNSDLAGERLP